MAKTVHPSESSCDTIPLTSQLQGSSSTSQLHNNSSSSTSQLYNNNNSSQPNMNSLARRSALTLPLNRMAIPIYTSVSREEVEAGGQMLFQHFVHEEFEHEGLSDESLTLEAEDNNPYADVGPAIFRGQVYSSRPVSPSVVSTPEGYKNTHLMQIGSNIRELANEFAKSRERPLIRQQADQVDLAHINRENFIKMLEEIFKNGVNKHCIVALFFFCADVLIRCAKERLRNIGAELFWWCLQFISDRVCKWVYDNGGWEKVFSNIWGVAIRVASFSLILVGLGCGVVYLRKNWN